MAERHYDFKSVEAKWQATWREQQTFTALDDSKKTGFYCLTMFPYPSGVLHAGHCLAYTIPDVIARHMRMRGFNVLMPMGWDSFGLPAENAAIRASVPPKISTERNIDKMRLQMHRGGWGFDWSREFSTHQPDYYRWTQWLFLQLYRNKLAFKKNAPVNWCPSCQTVIANEQVVDGGCERCGTEIEQRDLNQWFFKMSAYAQRLLDGHAKLRAGWPGRVIKMQEEWIGRSEGARIDFTIAETGEKLSVFTTRPDTLWGVTFMSLAPEHPLIEKLVKGKPQESAVMTAVREMRKVTTSERETTDYEKIGVWTGCHIINPVNGSEVQLWVANFAVMTYGTGAVMSVPAHDQRDFEFATKYNLPIKIVIEPTDRKLQPATMKAAYVDDGTMTNSGPFSGKQNREAIPNICKWLADNKLGEATITYKLRDWLISRQRYWGCPIPIVYCDKCGEVPVPEDHLPVRLPESLDDYAPKGKSPLAACQDFVNTKCPKCGAHARRETDTIDTFIDSSWYFLRYLSPRFEAGPFRDEDVRQWMPVDLYTGGVEHATMHLIYFRFFTMALHDMGLLEFDEPAPNLFCQGLVCKTAYYCTTDKWLRESEVDTSRKACRCTICGGPVRAEMTKVSKTKLNTVDPDAVLDKFGADAMRLMILSDTPPDRDQVWSEDGLDGSARFLRRLWAMVYENIEMLNSTKPFASDIKTLAGDDRELCRAVHQTIKSATDDYENSRHFNTAIARIFELINAMKAAKTARPPVLRLAYETILKLLSPIAPHICHELWQELGHEELIVQTPWPEHDEAALVAEQIDMAVQINGKVRSKISVASSAAEPEIREAALADEKVQAAIAGKQIAKVIIVPKRLVNIVVK